MWHSSLFISLKHHPSHLERSGFQLIDSMALTTLPALQELWLNSNIIYNIPSMLFNANTNLRILHVPAAILSDLTVDAGTWTTT